METETLYCKNCRANVPAGVWELHESRCSRMCWYCDKCEMVMNKNARVNHEKKMHAQIECECGEVIDINLLKEHTKKACTEREIECKWCEYPVRARELAKHEDACGNKTEPCEECGERVKLVDSEKHVCRPSTPPQALETVICPFCELTQADYVILQEHIFVEHPEITS